jgi:hypothetical protein
MLAVSDKGKLHVPLFYSKPNNMTVRFNVEDCKEGRNFNFPLFGDFEKWLVFHQEIGEFTAKDTDKEMVLPTIKYWDMYRDLLSKQSEVRRFEMIELTHSRLSSLVYDSEKKENTGLSFRFLQGMPNVMYYRSPWLMIEQRFVAAHSIFKNVPKAIDLALTSCGEMGYKGNYAVIDLDRWFKEGVMSYERS